MKPEILAFGFSSFLICFILHIFIWRLYHPHRHALALLGVFFLPLAALIPLVGFLRALAGVELFAVALLHAALSCAYIQVYPASQAQSPSFKILLFVGKAMPAGLAELEIQAQFKPAELLEERIQDLIDAGLVREENGFLELTPSGRVMIFPFVVFRAALGLSAGAG